MIAQLDFQAGDTVIDCGANIGELWYWFRFNDKPVRYVAFEPSPAEFSALQQNVPGGELFNMGLWNEEAELTFYVSSEEADSSLIEPSGYSEVIRMRTARLDQFIDRKIKLLKLEAEGAEPEILVGVGDKLGLIEYISADLGFERGKDHENTLVPVVNYLTARGFELVEIYAPRFTALFRNTAFPGKDATNPVSAGA